MQLGIVQQDVGIEDEVLGDGARGFGPVRPIPRRRGGGSRNFGGGIEVIHENVGNGVAQIISMGEWPGSIDPDQVESTAEIPCDTVALVAN